MSHSHDDILEIAKISISEEHQHFCFKPQIMEDPIDWGYLLADFTRQLADSYEGYQEGDSHTVLKRILEGFETQLTSAPLEQEQPHNPQIVTYSNCK
ncbi:MAG: DUF5076 domain-containing protein [Gammaproteobacteria bacterium]|jgi:hypothetical protein